MVNGALKPLETFFDACTQLPTINEYFNFKVLTAMILQAFLYNRLFYRLYFPPVTHYLIG